MNSLILNHDQPEGIPHWWGLPLPEKKLFTCHEITISRDQEGSFNVALVDLIK
jgi:hypothetical protein